jgi:predicted small metal-binding protein
MSDAEDVLALLERVRKLGPNGDAKLVGALSVLAPETLRMALDRLERHEAEKAAQKVIVTDETAKRRTVSQAKADTHTALTQVLRAKAEVQKQMRAEDPFDRVTTTGPRPGDIVRCPEFGPKCGFELEVSEEDPDAALSEMMRHFRWLHGASRDQAYTMLANIRTVR